MKVKKVETALQIIAECANNYKDEELEELEYKAYIAIKKIVSDYIFETRAYNKGKDACCLEFRCTDDTKHLVWRTDKIEHAMSETINKFVFENLEEA